jgi:hypothetical protein
MTARLLALAVAALALPVPAGAEPAMIDFIAHTTDSSQMFMTGQADGIMELGSVWDRIGAEGGPLAGLKGPCFGTARMSGGMISGEGYCAYTDDGGDTFFVRWWMENAAAPNGAWVAAGGTGKWATATGGGVFEDMPGETEGTGKSHITGMIDFE